jgi:glutathione-regulated potassium-efflux system ancillary protein KefC
MLDPITIAAIWLGLAVIATILANKAKVSMALMEIIIGVAAGYIATQYFEPGILQPNADWLTFIASSGAILLTFLSGLELDPATVRKKTKEISVVGLIGFFAPFLGCTAIALFLLHWSTTASLLAGVALSTTSMAVVYAVMLEYGFNKTDYGKGIIGACFINDLATVIALGLIFAPFDYKTVIFIVVAIVAFIAMPKVTDYLIKHFAYKTAAIRTKWIIFVLFALGALAVWAGSEAVLPAYILGIVLAGVVSKDNFFIRRLRTLTIGFLTPFYFLRAGSFVSIPALLVAPLIFVAFLAGKLVSKILGLYPVIGRFKEDKRERWYYTLMMSTGLTFGTISALYGLSHGIITQDQYSYIVAVVIASAVIPTLIANFRFLPSHLLKRPLADEEIPQEDQYNTNGNREKANEKIDGDGSLK